MSHYFLPWHPNNLNDSRCNSSNTEAGVLEAITGHGSNLPVRGVRITGITGNPWRVFWRFLLATTSLGGCRSRIPEQCNNCLSEGTSADFVRFPSLELPAAALLFSHLEIN
ncbi:unnamed protein product [Larinioides sclopetarius]|uniref:Uncharacterized protein n=1 Tax=Larinioides sclopetarius TaxID=280406 RepID=A0AAV1ZL97_9ARAC